MLLNGTENDPSRPSADPRAEHCWMTQSEQGRGRLLLGFFSVLDSVVFKR